MTYVETTSGMCPDLAPKPEEGKCRAKRCRARQPAELLFPYAHTTAGLIALCAKHVREAVGTSGTIPTPLPNPEPRPAPEPPPHDPGAPAVDVTDVIPVIVDRAAVVAESLEAQNGLTHLQAYTITDDASAEWIGGVLVAIKTRQKALEEKRDTVLRPLNDAVKALRELFKPAQLLYAECERTIKLKIAERHTYLETQRRAAFDAVNDAATAQEVTAALAVLPSTEAPKLEGISVRKVWKFEVIDAQKVPRGFLCVDEQAIRRAIANGFREIDGVRIYEEEQVSARSST